MPAAPPKTSKWIADLQQLLSGASDEARGSPTLSFLLARPTMPGARSVEEVQP